jgi:hypothetical protein
MGVSRVAGGASVAFTVVAGACLVMAGCSVPLGRTSYPVASMAGIEGVWVPRPGTEPAGQAGASDDADLRYTVTIRPVEATWPPSEADGGAKVWAPLAIGSGERYVVSVRIEGTAVPPESGFVGVVSREGGPNSETAMVVDLEGQFVRTREHVLFTFQRRMIDVTGLSVPLQRTARVTWIRGGAAGNEELRVQFPVHEMAFVPVPMAGELRFVPPSGGGKSVSLVAAMDDAFRTLDGLGEDGWRPASVLVRKR